MESQTLKRYLAYSMLVATFALSVAPAHSQERKVLPNDEIPIIKVDCPKPIALTLTANPPSVVATDFSPAQLAAQVGFNYQGSNKQSLYSFQWKMDARCCQYTKAVLIVKVKANKGGQSATSPDAGNDGIAIMHSGVSVQSEAVYNSWPLNAGQTFIKQMTLNAAALNNMSISGHLSFAVQDDTSVQSATLQLYGCCLTAAK